MTARPGRQGLRRGNDKNDDGAPARHHSLFLSHFSLSSFFFFCIRFTRKGCVVTRRACDVAEFSLCWLIPYSLTLFFFLFSFFATVFAGKGLTSREWGVPVGRMLASPLDRTVVCPVFPSAGTLVKGKSGKLGFSFFV